MFPLDGFTLIFRLIIHNNRTVLDSNWLSFERILPSQLRSIYFFGEFLDHLGTEEGWFMNLSLFELSLTIYFPEYYIDKNLLMVHTRPKHTAKNPTNIG